MSHFRHVETSAWLALSHPRGHDQARAARLLQDREAAHGLGHREEAVGEQLLLVQPRVHGRHQSHVPKLLHVQQAWRGNFQDSLDSVKFQARTV